MRPSTIARRYAQAAFHVASEEDNVAQWITDLAAVSDRIGSDAGVREYFRDPNVAADEKVEAVSVLFSNVHAHVANLVRELVSRQRFYLIPQVLGEFARLERAARGVADTYVTVARPVSDSQAKTIATDIATALGRQVEVHLHVDPSLLGGIIVRIGDQVYDSSVATRLQRLRQALAV
jgi:F-type H+-transporting ATPase subunit delta